MYVGTGLHKNFYFIQTHMHMYKLACNAIVLFILTILTNTKMIEDFINITT